MSERQPVQIGDVRWSYWIDPCGSDGQPINGGNNYANADSAEDARAVAEWMLTRENGVYLGYALDSVAVRGREVWFTGRAWRTVRAGASEAFRVTRADVGLEALD